MTLTKNILALTVLTITFGSFVSGGRNNGVLKMNFSTKIIGGQQARIFEYPFIGELQTGSFVWDYKTQCPITMLSLHSGLISGTCADYVRGKTVTALFGNDGLDISPYIPQRTSTGSITYHPGYNSVTKEHNLAMVNWGVTLIPAKNVNPATLYNGIDSSLPLGTNLRALDFASKSNGEFLQSVDLINVDYGVCNSTQNIALVCAKTIDTNRCIYNSGAPIIDNRTGSVVVVGILNSGSDCFSSSSEPFVGNFTGVSNYASWINSHI